MWLEVERFQTSESIRLGIVLAMAGGFMDAYSYIGRGGVFANAETGNIVLLAVSLGDGQFGMALHYLAPIIAFATGVLLSEWVKRTKKGSLSLFHWRQIVLMYEMLSMIMVAFLPQEWNFLANSLISLACGIQVTTFAKIHGHGMATTMCTGNLRTGTQSLNKYFQTKDARHYKDAVFYYGCIAWFVIGAMIGNFYTRQWQEMAILVVVGLLGVAYVMMFFNKEANKDM